MDMAEGTDADTVGMGVTVGVIEGVMGVTGVIGGDMEATAMDVD